MHFFLLAEGGNHLNGSMPGGKGSKLVSIQSGNVKLRHLGAIKSHFQHMALWSG